MSLVSGTRLGPYEMLTALGVGGMGEDYRAKDTRLGRDVAIKVLPESLFESGASTLWREIAPAERTGLVGIQSIRVATDCQTYMYSPWVQADTLLVMSGVE